MLGDDISTALASGKTVRTIAAEFAERLMADAKLLKSELQGGGPLTRKTLCEFLGIGESTLTGWLQADRMPQSAAVAYVLLLAASSLHDQVATLERTLSDCKVIDLGDKYAVVRFDTDANGESTGRVIASGIADRSAAQTFAFSQSSEMLKLVSRQLGYLAHEIELTEQAGNDTPLRTAEQSRERNALQRLKNLLTNEQRATVKKYDLLSD